MDHSQISTSPDQTYTIAANLLAQPNHSNIIGLVGELGSGKTTFTQGLAQALKITDPVTSPTFLLMKSYPIEDHPRFHQLVHLDLYRIYEWQELYELDLETLWTDPTNLVVIEWADRIMGNLPVHTQIIKFEHIKENQRRITFGERASS